MPRGSGLIQVNIKSLLQAYASLDEVTFGAYLNHHQVAFKEEEINDLKGLIGKLDVSTDQAKIFNGFFVGYKIPQIGKEFDLLRFGDDYVLNIEIKSISSEEKIAKQLRRNKYYLSNLQKDVFALTYISNTGKLYTLNDLDILEEVDFSLLVTLLINQNLQNLDDADVLFNPSDYLVSPFNASEKFIGGHYFLTSQQEEIKSKVLMDLNVATGCQFVTIVGSAGTGKTLLIYDVYKSMLGTGKKPIIVHCGNLNGGQVVLKEHGWNISPIKNVKHLDLSFYDVIIIDEAQRIYTEQLDEIVNNAKQYSRLCVFSYDKVQTLATWEDKNNIDARLNQIGDLKKHKLSEKIRTNKEVANFIKSLFNKKRNFQNENRGNIRLNYFNNVIDARHYLSTLDKDEWEVLRFTPSQYNKEHHKEYSDEAMKSSHAVIGQEFEGVAVTIDRHFSYDNTGALVYNANAYYDPVKMLFQNITRTRKRLDLVIISNKEMLNRCLSILG